MRTALRLAILGLLAACVPDDHPTWLIDHPMPWGIIATVIEPGGYSSELIVPEGHLRAAALPLDTLELQWLAVAPPGTELPPPIWLVCTGSCSNDLSSFSGHVLEPTCPYPLPLSRAQPCRLGEGERIRLALGGAFTADERFSGTIAIMGISSGDPDLDPETCLQRLSTRPLKGLESCLIQHRHLRLGPPWMLYTAVPQLAGRYTLEGDGLPDDAADEPADTHPNLIGIDVFRVTDRGHIVTFAAKGDTIRVRAGERLTFNPICSDSCTQEYYRFGLPFGGEIEFSLESENFRYRAALSALVEGDGPILNGVWVAPDDPEPITLYLYIADSREGRAHATFTFITDNSIDAP